jgi:hypothetical protein
VAVPYTFLFSPFFGCCAVLLHTRFDGSRIEGNSQSSALFGIVARCLPWYSSMASLDGTEALGLFIRARELLRLQGEHVPYW